MFKLDYNYFYGFFNCFIYRYPSNKAIIKLSENNVFLPATISDSLQFAN